MSIACSFKLVSPSFAMTLIALITMLACVEPPAPVSTPTEEMDAAADLAGDMDVMPGRDMPDDAADLAPDAADLAPDAAQDMPAIEEMGSIDMAPDMQNMQTRVECGQTFEQEPAGSGTPEDPFLLCDQNHFQKMNFSDKHFLLGKDILLDDTWQPLDAFRGTLDGQGFRIENARLILRDIKNASPCEDYKDDNAFNTVMGSFIHTLNGATVRDVTFLKPLVGAGPNQERIPAELVQEGTGRVCYLTTGGIFGQIRQHNTQRSTLERINILGMTARASGRFGGLAYRIRNANLSQIFMGPEQVSDTQIFLTDTQSGGFVGELEASTLRDVHVDLKMYIESDTPNVHNRDRSEYVSHGLFAGRLADAIIDGLIVRGSMTNTQSVDDGAILGHIGGLAGNLDLAEPTSALILSHCLIDVSMTATGAEHTGAFAGNGRFKQGNLEVTDCMLEASLIDGTRRGAGIFGQLNFILTSYTSIIDFSNLYLNARLEGIGRNGCLYADSSQPHAATLEKINGFTQGDMEISFPEPVMMPLTCDDSEVLAQEYEDSLKDTWDNHEGKLYPNRVVELLDQRQ